MELISTPVGPVHGTLEPEFQPILNAFVENMTELDELGAATCIFYRGRKVVDIWGGYMDAARTRAWQADTLVNVMSVSKSIAAMALHLLLDRGQVELEKPVASYWPDFGQAGKEDITVRELLGGRAGILFLDHAPAGSMLDYEAMARALEQQPAELPPNGEGAYHSLAMGTLLSELVRHVDGRDISQFVSDEFSVPVGVEFGFGVPDVDLHRVATMVHNPNNETTAEIRKGADASPNFSRAYRVQPAEEDFMNSQAWRRAVFPSGNGISNARAIASFYAVLAQRGVLDGRRFFSSTAIDTMRELQWDGNCGFTGRHYRYGMGFFLNLESITPMGPNPSAFGHYGAGGAFGFADPEAEIAFSYTPNFHCAGTGVGERCEALVDALYNKRGEHTW